MKKTIVRTVTGLTIIALLLNPQPKAKAQSNPKVIAEFCVGLVVVAVGAIVIYKLCKVAKKLVPPVTPPTPPPPPTNAPPATNHFAFQASSDTPLPVLNLGGDEGEVYDISSSGLLDPDGNRFVYLYVLTLMSSTNLGQWSEECTVTGWCSASWFVAVSYNAGVPVDTNWSRTAVNTLNSGGCSTSSKFFKVTSP